MENSIQLTTVRCLSAIARCAMLICLLSQTASAQSSPTLVRVEEDWILLVDEPDSALASPQILNVISPKQNLDGIFGMVQLNHRSDPNFYAGGQQVQTWVGPSLMGYASGTKTAVLNRTADRITYTVSMEQVSTGIRFQLKNGRSRTWGRFAWTPVSVTVPTTEKDLSAYTPEFSTTNTTVVLGAHRITSFYIDTTRKVHSDGSIVTDTTDRFTHRYQLSIEDVAIEEYQANPEDYEVDIAE
jgi:hypothetical protein